MNFISFQEAAREQEHAAVVLRHSLKALFDELTEEQLRSQQMMLEVIMADKKAAWSYHGMITNILDTKFKTCWACRSNPCTTEHGIEQLLGNAKPYSCPICGEAQGPIELPTAVGESIVLSCDHNLQKIADDETVIRAGQDAIKLPDTCPSCGSHDPRLHPATQAEGEVLNRCPNSWHRGYPKSILVDASQLAGDADGLKIDWPDLKVGETGALSPYQISAMQEWNLDDLREEGTNKFLGFICLGCKKMRHPTIEDRALRPHGVEGCSGCQQKAKFG